MTAWSTLTWDVARAGGFVAYGLLTVSVLFGLALSLGWKSVRWPRLITNEMHTFTTLLALVFTMVHVAAVWVDPFTAFRASEVFLPFVSHYRPLWVAFGIISFYLGIAIGLSVFLRPKIGYMWWRRLHFLTFGVFLFTTVHGVATGSDTSTWWGFGIYGAATLGVFGMTMARLLKTTGAGGRARRPFPTVAAIAALMLLSGGLLAYRGPLQPGWNTIANGGRGSGARVPVPGSGTTAAAPTFVLPFSAALQGSLQVRSGTSSPSGLDIVTHFNAASRTNRLEILMQGSQTDAGFTLSTGQVLVGTTSGPMFQGPITQASGQTIRAVVTRVTSGTPERMTLNITLTSVSSAGQVQGSVTATAS